MERNLFPHAERKVITLRRPQRAPISTTDTKKQTEKDQSDKQ